MLNGSSNGGKSLTATYDKANAANSNAASANTKASTAASRVWDSTEGKSAATLSKEARDKANATSGDATYIRNTQLPSLENSITSLEATINNNFISDKSAPIITKVEGQNGATCTTNNKYTLVVTVSESMFLQMTIL